MTTKSCTSFSLLPHSILYTTHCVSFSYLVCWFILFFVNANE